MAWSYEAQPMHDTYTGTCHNEMSQRIMHTQQTWPGPHKGKRRRRRRLQGGHDGCDSGVIWRIGRNKDVRHLKGGYLQYHGRVRPNPQTHYICITNWENIEQLFLWRTSGSRNLLLYFHHETCAELSKLDVSQKQTQVVMTKMNILEPGAYPGTWMATQEK